MLRRLASIRSRVPVASVRARLGTSAHLLRNFRAIQTTAARATEVFKSQALKDLTRSVKAPHDLVAQVAKVRVDKKAPMQIFYEACMACNFSAAIFADPDCDIYLKILIDEGKIPPNEGKTILSYLMGLAQFTPQQALRLEDADVKSFRNIEVKALVKGGQLTELGEGYLKETCRRFAELNVEIDPVAFRKCLLAVSPIEQQVLCVELFQLESYHDPISFIANRLTLTNIPMTVQIGDQNTLLVPSTSILNFLLKQVDPAATLPYPVLGSITAEQRTEMFKNGLHPEAFYSRHISCNPRHADNLRCGPFLMWIHDLGHAFWKCWLKGHDVIFKFLIPAFEKLSHEAKVAGDDYTSKILNEMIAELGDFNLTPVRSFLDPKTRLEAYLCRIRILITGMIRRELSYTIGGQAEDHLYFLFQKLSHSPLLTKEQQRIMKCFTQRVLPPSSTVCRVEADFCETDERIAEALASLAKNAARVKPLPLSTKPNSTIDWKAWLVLLDKTTDSSSLWALAIKRQDELLQLITKHNLLFYPPYLPMTADKRNEFKAFVLKNIESADVKAAPVSMKKCLR